MAEAASNEAALRVAFVYKFIKFIEWPNQTSTPLLRLCVLGADGDAKEAVQSLNGQPVSRHIVDGNFVVKQAIEIVYLDDASSVVEHIQTCQMLYRPSHAISLNFPHPPPVGVLVVVDDPSPNDADIAIALARNDDGRIEFSISMAAANHAGVNISSQLLKLSKTNRGGGI
jgi:hypothetical protein